MANELQLYAFSVEDNILDTLGTRQELNETIAALDVLPDSDLEVLLLFVWERQSYEDIADIVGIPVGTVRSRIHHARRRLAAICNQRKHSQPPLSHSCEGSEYGPGPEPH